MTAQPTSPTARRQHLVLAAILGASVLVRAWYWLSVRGADLVTVPYLDCHDYDVWARALVAGDWGVGQPYWMGPLYPHLLAVFYAAFGPESPVVLYAQLALTVVNLVLVHRLARVWLGPTPALVATALYAGYGPPVFYAGLRLMVTLVTTLMLVIAWRAQRAVDEPTNRRWLVLGAVIGVAALARGNVLVLLPLLPVVLLQHARIDWSRRARLVTLAWLGAALVIAPVTFRNLVVGRDFVLLTSNAGVNLLIGQQAQYAGRFGPLSETPQFEFDPTGETLLEADLGHDLKPSQVSRELTRRAVARIRREPGVMVAHYARKTYRFWSGYELPQIFSWNFWRLQYPALQVLPIGAVGLLGCGLVGGFLLAPVARSLWLTLMGGWFLGLLPFFPTARYRQPVMGLMAIGTAAWLAAVVVSVREGRRRRAVLLLLVAACLVAALWPNWSALDRTDEIWHSHLARASRAADAGDREALLEAVTAAETVRPGMAETPYRQGGYLEKLGETTEALRAYRVAVQRSPSNPFTLYRVGRSLASLGRHFEAITWYTRAAAADTAWSLAPHALGLSLQSLGRFNEAADAFARAVALEPGRARLRSNLASALAEAGRDAEAFEILRRLVSDFPDYVPGWFNLALAEARRGNTNAARQALSRAAALPGITVDQADQIEALAQRLTGR